MTLEMEKNERK